MFFHGLARSPTRASEPGGLAAARRSSACAAGRGSRPALFEPRVAIMEGAAGVGARRPRRRCASASPRAPRAPTATTPRSPTSWRAAACSRRATPDAAREQLRAAIRGYEGWGAAAKVADVAAALG